VLGIDITIWNFWLKFVVAIAAGAWAIFLLRHLRKSDVVDVDITKKQREIKELELKTRRQVSVSVDIQVDMSAAPEGQILITTVAITNHGNEATRIMWQDEPPAFTVRFVRFDREGTPEHGTSRDFWVMSTRDPSKPAVSHVLRAGATETLTFAFQTDQPGLYLLSFRGAVDKDIRKEAKSYGVQMPTAWTAKRYVFVGKACMTPGAAPEAPRPLVARQSGWECGDKEDGFEAVAAR